MVWVQQKVLRPRFPQRDMPESECFNRDASEHPMNHVERLVYDVLKSNPRLKMRVRDLYQTCCDRVPVVRNRSAYPVDVREGFFFGFHDKSPWSFDDRYLLAHRELIPLRMPRPDDLLEVGLFDEAGGKQFRPLAKTRAWNWHQGAQLQWLGTQFLAVYNDFDGTNHVARVVDLEGNRVRTLPKPVAAVSPDGSFVLSYSFARLRGTPHGYAYANGEDPEADRLLPREDGIWIVDANTGESNRLFTVEQIAQIEPHESMSGAFHYFSHCQVSPSGARFKFFHRWTTDANRNWTRMFTADVRGGNLHLIGTSGMVSHVCWRGPEHLVAYARTSRFGDAYYEFDDRSDAFRVIGADSFSSDGHPSMSNDGRWMLTDTYADRFRRRFLVLFDTKESTRYNIAMFYSPKAFAGSSIAEHLQCDFHPRWSRANHAVCFDSAHTGTRSLCVMQLDELRAGGLRTI